MGSQVSNDCGQDLVSDPNNPPLDDSEHTFNHPKVDVLYNPLLDDSEHACKSSKIGCFV